MASHRDDAARLLRRSSADFLALVNMRNPRKFDDNIFGFHAQQAVEKALKAWLAILGASYPFRHDLAELLAALEAHGENVDDLWGLVDLTSFAVQLRYDEVDVGYPLDREALIKAIGLLIDRLERIP